MVTAMALARALMKVAARVAERGPVMALERALMKVAARVAERGPVMALARAPVRDPLRFHPRAVENQLVSVSFAASFYQKPLLRPVFFVPSPG